MAASIKISELNSLTNLTDVDLFLVSDMESATSKKISYSTLKSNLVDNLTTAVSNLTGVVSQNNTTVTARVDSLESDSEWLFANQAAFPSATDNHGRVVHSHADGAMYYAHAGAWFKLGNQSDIDSLNQSLTVSLGSVADDVTALQTKVDDLDIDIAPETLNSINELSAAMGDDPNFLAAKLDKADPVFTGIITGPDIDIGNGHLTVAGSGGVVSNVGFFSSGLLSIGGNASFTDNVTFSSGDVNFLDVIKIDDVVLTASATELNYVAGVTSDIQTQITSLKTTVDNLEIDIAPETLNSINELSAAMGDDPAFLTTLQGRVTTIEGDIATQTELDAYKAEIEDRNLQLALAYDTPLFVESLNAA